MPCSWKKNRCLDDQDSDLKSFLSFSFSLSLSLPLFLAPQTFKQNKKKQQQNVLSRHSILVAILVMVGLAIRTYNRRVATIETMLLLWWVQLVVVAVEGTS
jgi:putative effector of murein hydrolase